MLPLVLDLQDACFNFLDRRHYGAAGSGWLSSSRYQ
jgi:hypothetical protein